MDNLLPEDEPRHGLYNETQTRGANTCDSDEQLNYQDGGGQWPPIGEGQCDASGYRVIPYHKGQRHSKGQAQFRVSGCGRDSYDGNRHLKVSWQNSASGYGVDPSDSQFFQVGQKQEWKSSCGGVPHNGSQYPTRGVGQGSATLHGGDPYGGDRDREARQHSALDHYSRVQQQDQVGKHHTSNYVQHPHERAGDKGQGQRNMPIGHSPCGMGGTYMTEMQDMPNNVSRSSQSSTKETSASKPETSRSKESQMQDGGISGSKADQQRIGGVEKGMKKKK